MATRTFTDLKDAIITDPSKESKYGRFLDKIGYEDKPSQWGELGDGFAGEIVREEISAFERGGTSPAGCCVTRIC